MTYPIVYRLSSVSDAPDFDAYEINEETKHERIVGYVSVPYPKDKARHVPTLYLLTDGEDGKLTWHETDLSWSTPYCDMVQLMHLSLMLHVVPRPTYAWSGFGDRKAALSLKSL